MVEQQSTKLAMAKQPKGSGCTVDKMTPRRDQSGVDTEALSPKRKRANLSSTVKRRILTIAAGHLERTTKTVKRRQRVHAPSARASEKAIAAGGERLVAVKKIAGWSLNPMSIRGAKTEVNATKTASSRSQDTLGVANHFDGVRHAVLAKQGRENSASSADLLGLAKAFAHESTDTAVGVTLGGVVVGDEAWEGAELRAQGKVQGVPAMAMVLSEESLSGGVNKAVDEVDVDGDGGVRGQGAAKTVDAGEATRNGKARATHRQRE